MVAPVHGLHNVRERQADSADSLVLHGVSV
jgi:hypothetical protein